MYSHKRKPYGKAPRTKKYAKTARSSGAVVPLGSYGTQNRLANLMGAKRRLAVEKKFVDLNDTSYTLNTTPLFTCLNLVRVGSGEVNRIGRKIQMKYLYITGDVETIRTQADDDMCRIMVVYDRQSNGATPAIADIVRSVYQDGTTTSSSAMDHLNLDNASRFLVLMDKRIYLPSMTWTAGVVTNGGSLNTGGSNFIIKKFIKLRNLETQFKADSNPAVIGDIATGALWLITWAANKAAGAEGYELDLGIRLRFCDV